MMKFEFWQVILIAAFVLWAAFRWGMFYGRDKERRASQLYKEAQNENDPERKKKLLLEWNELTEDKDLRKSFKRILLKGEKKKDGDSRPTALTLAV